MPVGSEAPEILLLRVSEHAARAALEAGCLSEEERERVAVFRRREDRDRYRVAHTALRHELARRLGTVPAGVPLVRGDCPLCGGPHGRPGVAGDPLHFSLSHAGDVVLLAFAGAPVGVDAEREPGLSVVAEVSGSLHPRERDELAALPGERRPGAFARCWTRKEAYVKGTGTEFGAEPSVTYVGTGGLPASAPGWRIGDIAAPGGYAAAWALRLD
ncbi:4'-phosphopantetheinyl transferase superfamily protein [Streptomyces sp. HNM0575]|uniref:4'-phosphopantetheinyl transferase family protein n=1 Tax=Streptomyces sp. HNM0575 TaxID=2716338 RepID=UPI00145F4D54|nr:4'-phosphopantetheinyl transferase superfamily protein [Streptomyces sp. HNM0575]NLU72829.1 4'-phosphopantetheinyl transferase superfamily protein [Streptomyces sp. HNM0575]